MPGKIVEEQSKLFNSLSGDAKEDYFVNYFICEIVSILKEKRIALKITKEELASRMGVSQAYILKIENYDVTPKIKTIAKYAYALGTSIEEIAELSELVRKNMHTK